MPTVEIDFELFKHLTMRRRSEDHSINDVIREMAGLAPQQTGAGGPPKGGWVSKGVHFPENTELRASYKGKEYLAVIKDGGIVVEGKKASSLSNAATQVTKTNVDGWKFWECRVPGTTGWRSVANLREAAQL